MKEDRAGIKGILQLYTLHDLDMLNPAIAIKKAANDVHIF